MIHNRFKELKDEEKFYTSLYIKYKYNFIPTFIDTKSVIPDCYFEYNNEYYAVEVTRYFQQNSEKEHQEYVKNVEKYIKDNSFKQIYDHLGKKKPDDVTISFYNLDDLKSMIIENREYIECISIDNNFYYNNKKDLYGDVFIIGNSKEKMTIEEFIYSVSPIILEEKHIVLDIFTKNKYNVSIEFLYCKFPYYGKDNNKRAIQTFCWFENKNELYGNIINAIVNKNKKLINEYIPKLNKNKIDYNYYNLVVYNEGYPANLDASILYDLILKIDDLKYQEIAIFLWNKIMIVNNTGYQIIDTQK